ncbi:hypothetical protein TNCV_266411 [Trichonephila clavipes]|nr:hypothetical protein TNCV_266411 [Trichonephila clavipes]
MAFSKFFGDMGSTTVSRMYLWHNFRLILTPSSTKTKGVLELAQILPRHRPNLDIGNVQQLSSCLERPQTRFYPFRSYERVEP